MKPGLFLCPRSSGTWRAWAATALISAAAALAQAGTPMQLLWNNGEKLAGEVVEATAAELTWRTPLFSEPLVLGWGALRQIERTGSLRPVAEAFSVTLRDGSHLSGDLVAISPETVTLRSARHGETVLKRSELLSLQRLHGGSILMAGPSGEEGWVSAGVKINDGEHRRVIAINGMLMPATVREQPPAGNASPTGIAPGGALLLPFWNRSVMRKVTFPERWEVEFRLSSTVRPDFSVTLQDGAAKALRLETWDDEIVLTANDEFHVVRTLREEEREVALRIFWDEKTRHCAVYTVPGELLTEWEVPEETGGSANSAVLLQNKGRDLALEFFRLRAWDGQPPAHFEAGQPRLELSHGRVQTGEIRAATAQSVTILPAGQAEETTVPLEEIDGLIFSPDRPRTAPSAMTLIYPDGTLLHGRIVSIQGEEALLETAFTASPLHTRLEEMRRLSIAGPPAGAGDAPALETLDTLVLGSTTLHGRVVGRGEPQPRWFPAGGAQPVLLSGEGSLDLRRAFPPGAELPGAAALFYTKSGDVLPGTLRALNREQVEFDGSIIEHSTLPANELKAVQFGVNPVTGIKGFEDPAWRVLKGTATSVRRTGERLEMEAGAALAHPSAMQSSEIKFTFEPSSFGAVRLRLFCAGTDSTKAMSIVILRMSDRVSTGLEGAEGQFESQIQQKVPSRAMEVRLLVREKELELDLNGGEVQRFPFEPARRTGSGLILEPASMWGNMVNAVSLSGFSARTLPGQLWVPEVGPETKTQALTIPRFRKDDPPRHALLAANGDLLRGEIEGVTATHFGFRTGLENLRVPIDRVKAAIWLQPPLPVEAPPAPEPAGAPKYDPAGLERKVTHRAHFNAATLRTMLSVLQQEFPDLKFKAPARDTLRAPISFGGKTLAETLDEVCAVLRMRYHEEPRGAIVLEPAEGQGEPLVSRAYWLKPDAFAEKASVQEILQAHGVAFAKGATAAWDARTSQLVVLNSSENQAALLELLKTEFGGLRGSPTHWLELTSGARLGLEVTKFDPDFVIGHHPVYGECRVPMAQVARIRNSPPEATSVMNSLEDWHLVFAPEPVLPGTGGESSPLLNKEAKVFKAPLLAGGEFDLAAERGKIVVLDFWATWCGPCIKSLPGLMEAIAALPPDRVRLIGVNQGEPAEQVKQFLDTRGWPLAVALDPSQTIGRQYGAEGIPHTVIVGPDGVVAWVKTGYDPNGAQEVTEAIQKLLAPPAAPERLPEK